MNPEIDQGVEVSIQRVHGSDVQNEVNEHVRVQVADEEERRGPGIFDADRSRFSGAAKVVAHERDSALRRTLIARGVEGDEQRRALRPRVHVHGEVRKEDLAHERHELFCEPAKHHARIRVSRRRRQLLHARRVIDDPAAHGLGEQLLLRVDVTQDRRRRHVQLSGNVGQSDRLEPSADEQTARLGENLFAGDAWRTAHGVSKRMFTNRVCQWRFTNAAGYDTPSMTPGPQDYHPPRWPSRV